ncbi:hypothetical protein BK720_08165 [Bacillus thuringiensis serovar brasilensis]|uniref:N-acetylmuramoyl-L-alanine amidase family protein n=1 Tax=Bacillus cereus group TaxID=86661 RepID=UPI000A3843DC|nr:insecticidal delta-endotoxin Cry8Ea1 family protein [Bacillus thuringiensis]MCU5031465.1 insecticidal delta-endotoxin Cry8Ea1 family protein [Bacillus cereus]MRA74196.1 hypothetical protein [Bacillus thuringiensis]MRA92694.1 hypothetical protein [Bacillus thuringiensis]MRC55359.1 hypothetical protein [Bacillus thuringiensis]OTX35247.1 hypothetical protein BK720_08165 [Bacillus thuringiensis serovar brasilensis]
MDTKFLVTFLKELINEKSVNKVMASTGTQFIKNAQKNPDNFNNTFRTLAMVSAEFIPVGGIFISPLIGLLWKEEGTSDQINALRNELSELIDQKIETEHLHSLAKEFEILEGTIKQLESSVNGHSEEYFESHGTIQESRRNWAHSIQRSFQRLIGLASQDRHKIADLALYTKIALSHVSFLNCIHENGQGSKFKYDKQSLLDFFNHSKLSDIIDNYTKYIEKTFKEGDDKFKEKIKHREALKQDLIELRKQPSTGFGDLLKEKKMRDLEEQIKNYEKMDLENCQNKFYYTTWGDETLQALIKGRWTLKDGKLYFVNKNGEKQTRWLQLGVKWYYLSPLENNTNTKGETFNIGQMMIGWVRAEDKWYYLSPSDNNMEIFNTGQMMTRWAQDGDKWYYLAPVNDAKNYDGIKFAQGQMMTGWVQITDRNDKKDYYYFSPSESTVNYDGIKFAQGQMMVGWVKVSGKWYYLDKKDGYMLHDTITPDGYRVDEQGVLK